MKQPLYVLVKNYGRNDFEQAQRDWRLEINIFQTTADLHLNIVAQEGISIDDLTEKLTKKISIYNRITRNFYDKSWRKEDRRLSKYDLDFEKTLDIIYFTEAYKHVLNKEESKDEKDFFRLVSKRKREIKKSQKYLKEAIKEICSNPALFARYLVENLAFVQIADEFEYDGEELNFL